MSSLSPRQREVLEFLRAHVKAHGIPPSYQEIASFMGTASKSHALYVVDALVRAKLVSRPLATRRARAIELVETKEHHAPDCACGPCAHARYIAQRKLVEAIQAPIPLKLRAQRLHGIAPVSELTKVYWLRGFPASLKPSRRGTS